MNGRGNIEVLRGFRCKEISSTLKNGRNLSDRNLRDESFAKIIDLLTNRLRNVEVDWIADIVIEIRKTIKIKESTGSIRNGPFKERKR